MNLEKRYYKILNDIKENVKDERKRKMLTDEINEFVASAFSGLINLSEMEMFQKSTVIALSEMDDRIKDIEGEIYGDQSDEDGEEDEDEQAAREEYHKKIRASFDKLKSGLNNLEDAEEDNQKAEKDILKDIEKDYHFEMTCPKCHCDFEIKKEDEGKKKIACPKCNTIIDLDWSDEENETPQKTNGKEEKPKTFSFDDFDDFDATDDEENYDDLSDFPIKMMGDLERTNEDDFEYKKDDKVKKSNKAKNGSKDSKIKKDSKVSNGKKVSRSIKGNNGNRKIQDKKSTSSKDSKNKKKKKGEE